MSKPADLSASNFVKRSDYTLDDVYDFQGEDKQEEPSEVLPPGWEKCEGRYMDECGGKHLSHCTRKTTI